MSQSKVARPTGTFNSARVREPLVRSLRRYWPLVLIGACFILSRVLFWTLGVRFASSEVEYFWQFLDTSVLKHQLWVSILYLHSQPPLMNLFYGILFKVFPEHWPFIAYGINLLFGQVAWIAIYILMIKGKVLPPIALGVVIIAMFNPSAVVYEAEPLYTHIVFFLLVISAYLFENYLRRPRTGIGVAFLAVLAILVLWRSSYQIVWYALLALWLVKITPRKMFPKVLALALVFAAMLGSIYVKNGILFSAFNTSSGSGMRLAKSWSGTPDILTLVQEKKLSPISAIQAPNSMDKYLSVIGPLSTTGVEAVDAVFKENGSMNLNNVGYPEVTKLYTRDEWRLLKLSPATIEKQVSIGWLDYFRPTAAYISGFDPQNQSSVEGMDRWYRFFFCPGAQRALEFEAPVDNRRSATQKLQRRLKSVCWQIVLIYALFATFLVYAPFQRWITAGDGVQRQLLLFLISNVAYSAVLGNAVEVAENMRYRYETQGLALVAGTIIFCQIWQRSPEAFKFIRTHLQ